LALGAGVFASAPAFADNAFSALAGNWTGNGTVTYSSGTKERLRCKVKYDMANVEDGITQALRCASDSYKFQINAYYFNKAGTLTGHWDELSLQISGSITGNVSDAGKIVGALHGPGFLASVLVDTKGNEQTVNIAAEDQEIKSVTVSVKRGN
jgi:hypothetical protein